MDANAYLDRIGATRPTTPTVDALCELHERHLLTVPFENLSIHLGEPIDLDTDALRDKIVQRRRGGFCYELNSAFAGLLTDLGYSVDLLSARVARTSGGFTFPFDHMVLRVNLDEPWLADVGWGPGWPLRPLRLNTTDSQSDPSGAFRVVDVGAGEVDLCREGKIAYRIETQARELTDFAPACWWQQTHPDSQFRKGPTCSMPVDGGRITLAGNKLISTTDDNRVEKELADDTAILEAYRTNFGFDLPRVPTAPV